jgi:hypothetical protein
MRKIIPISIILMLITSLIIFLPIEKTEAGNGTSSFDPFDMGWNYRKQIKIDHNLVAGNLTDFPILICTADSDLIDKAQIDGDDILFMDDIGEASLFSHEVEYFNFSSGKLIAWVKLPVLSCSEDTVFYMYYGNSECDSQENVKDVWDSNFSGVWHLDTLNDSTINDNDGTNHGTDKLKGKIGNCRDFVKNNTNYIDLGDMSEPADNSIKTGTFEAWINPKDLDEGGTIISKMDKYCEPDRTSYTFYYYSSGQILFGVASGTWYPDVRSMWSTTDVVCDSSSFDVLISRPVVIGTTEDKNKKIIPNTKR